eukprot:TRINITY_DN832_c0_g1_i4.p1 TRINITY_DN832_c0_g1~~TRINITY_DN832_c0_g1_i4.p1  ORF type:complete len:877 (-),score=166.13 TRINITY_DN832_c0_g1_i4:4558-7188(-)
MAQTKTKLMSEEDTSWQALLLQWLLPDMVDVCQDQDRDSLLPLGRLSFREFLQFLFDHDKLTDVEKEFFSVLPPADPPDGEKSQSEQAEQERLIDIALKRTEDRATMKARVHTLLLNAVGLRKVYGFGSRQFIQNHNWSGKHLFVMVDFACIYAKVTRGSRNELEIDYHRNTVKRVMVFLNSVLCQITDPMNQMAPLKATLFVSFDSSQPLNEIMGTNVVVEDAMQHKRIVRRMGKVRAIGHLKKKASNYDKQHDFYSTRTRTKAAKNATRTGKRYRAKMQRIGADLHTLLADFWLDELSSSPFSFNGNVESNAQVVVNGNMDLEGEICMHDYARHIVSNGLSTEASLLFVGNDHDTLALNLGVDYDLWLLSSYRWVETVEGKRLDLNAWQSVRMPANKQDLYTKVCAFTGASDLPSACTAKLHHKRSMEQMVHFMVENATDGEFPSVAELFAHVIKHFDLDMAQKVGLTDQILRWCAAFTMPFMVEPDSLFHVDIGELPTADLHLYQYLSFVLTGSSDWIFNSIEHCDSDDFSTFLLQNDHTEHLEHSMLLDDQEMEQDEDDEFIEIFETDPELIDVMEVESTSYVATSDSTVESSADDDIDSVSNCDQLPLLSYNEFKSLWRQLRPDSMYDDINTGTTTIPEKDELPLLEDIPTGLLTKFDGSALEIASANGTSVRRVFSVFIRTYDLYRSMKSDVFAELDKDHRANEKVDRNARRKERPISCSFGPSSQAYAGQFGSLFDVLLVMGQDDLDELADGAGVEDLIAIRPENNPGSQTEQPEEIVSTPNNTTQAEDWDREEEEDPTFQVDSSDEESDTDIGCEPHWNTHFDLDTVDAKGLIDNLWSGQDSNIPSSSLVDGDSSSSSMTMDGDAHGW